MAPLIAAALCCLFALGGNPATATAAIRTTEELLDSKVEAVQVHDTPIADVLRLLAEQHDLNLIIGPDTMGNVTLRFSEVTLRNALDAILRSKGFQYQIYDNIMLVTKPDSLEKMRGLGLETELFKLKYSDARNIKQTIDTSRVLSPWGYTTVYFRTINVDAAKAASIKPGLAFIQGEQYTLVEQAASGTMPLQARSDVLIVTDKPEVLERVRRLITMLDQPHRQVAIDVHFVETILDDEHSLGVDWSKLLQVQGSYQGKTRWTLGDEPFPFAPESEGIMELGSLSRTRFNVILDMLLSQENTKLLSNPSVTTINHQPATIAVGITYWIEERTGTSATGDLRITYKERQIPIELIVVPHILNDDRIQLELRPRVEEITGFQEGVGGLQLPLISSRSADARVEVGNGETAVIGGLIKEKTLKKDNRVWLLSSLPLVGHLFRWQSNTQQRTDLTVFITPRIIEPPEAERAGSDVQLQGNLSERGAGSSLNPSVQPPAEAPPPAAPEKEVKGIEMSGYFPLDSGAHWGYNWSRRSGGGWESGFTVEGAAGDGVLVHELIPEGPQQYEARSAYRWGDQGMENIYRVLVDGDSTVYEPPRVILPARMVRGKVSENGYAAVSYDDRGRRTAERAMMQRQRLIGKFTVSTDLGRYFDCIAVETVWFDRRDPEGTSQRKVVWYAPGVGPVKVEQDIPPESPLLKGSISGLLTRR